MVYPKAPVLMRKLAIGMREGFTLIELLIVLFIIAMTASMIIVRLPGSRASETRLHNTTYQLVSLMKIAQEQALLQPTDIGVRIETHEYYFLEYIIQKNNKGIWQKVTHDSHLKQYRLPSGMFLSIDTKTKPTQPQIIFTDNGEMTPFVLTMGNNQYQYQIIGKRNGELTMRKKIDGNDEKTL